MKTPIRLLNLYDLEMYESAGEMFCIHHSRRVFGWSAPWYFTYAPRGITGRDCSAAYNRHQSAAATYLFLARYTAHVTVPPGYIPTVNRRDALLRVRHINL